MRQARMLTGELLWHVANTIIASANTWERCGWKVNDLGHRVFEWWNDDDDH